MKEGANLFSGTTSNAFDRVWVSRIGSDNTVYPFPGIRTRGGYCKHEMAVLIIRGDLSTAFPNGVPYQPRLG